MLSITAVLCARCQFCFCEAEKPGVFEKSGDGFFNDKPIRSRCVDRILWPGLVMASERGCPVCTWAVQGAREKFRTANVSNEAASLVPLRRLYTATSVGSSNTSPFTRAIKLSCPLWRRKDGDVNLSVLFEKIDAKAPAVTYRPGGNTGDEETSKLLYRWLRSCETSHTRCKEANRAGWLPSRLIRVTDASDGMPHAGLEEAVANTFGPATHYATLSHRWLPDEAVRLTRATLPMLRSAVPIADLKASVKDALILTRRLGLSYIWIDTLCIIQEDDDDRKREIPEMHNIYGHSFCTISANDAETSEQGCFWTRDQSSVDNYDISIDFRGDGHHHAYQIRQSSSKGHRELRRGALATRAWVFQERFLSRRVAHYTSRQLHWECREFEASETYPEGAPDIPFYTSWTGNHALYQPPGPLKDKPQSNDSDQQIPYWSEIVLQYTKRSMTFLDDRLHGLAGIAAFCSKLYSSRYMYGLWEQDLPLALLWRVASENTSTRLAHIAPSWSWAHVSGGILPESSYMKSNDTIFAKLLTSEGPTHPSPTDVQTRLVLSAPLLPGRLDDIDTISGGDFLDIAFADTQRGDRSRVVTMDTSEQHRPEVRFMPIVGRMPANTEGNAVDGRVECYGLVLQLVEDAEIPVFRRVGHYFQRGIPGEIEKQVVKLC